ncbi:hypothetical protein [Microcystis phage Mwe-JY26]
MPFDKYLSEDLRVNENLHQVLVVKDSVWPSLWDYSRKALLMRGTASLGVGRAILRSEKGTRPEWKTRVVRVSYLRIVDLTVVDAKMLGYNDETKTPKQNLDALISDLCVDGTTRYDFVTVAEIE